MKMSKVHAIFHSHARVLSVVFINLGALSWMDVSIYQDS
jgi:hypothetical protein